MNDNFAKEESLKVMFELLYKAIAEPCRYTISLDGRHTNVHDMEYRCKVIQVESYKASITDGLNIFFIRYLPECDVIGRHSMSIGHKLIDDTYRFYNIYDQDIEDVIIALEDKFGIPLRD